MRRSLVLAGLVLLLALPMAASQFIDLPFDQVARESTYVVRGAIDHTWSAWDDQHEVIYTYATLKVSRYFGETTGPDTLLIKEAGGTVDGYTQQVVGFPMLRGGEQVVLMLSKWEDASELRIHAYNQGKYLVRNRGGVEVLSFDPVKQGEEREHGGGIRTDARDDAPGLTIDEFATMVEDARAGMTGVERRQRQ